MMKAPEFEALTPEQKMAVVDAAQAGSDAIIHALTRSREFTKEDLPETSLLALAITTVIHVASGGALQGEETETLLKPKLLKQSRTELSLLTNWVRKSGT